MNEKSEVDGGTSSPIDSGRSSGRRQQIRFALGFAAIAAVLFGLYCFPYGENGVSETWFTSYLNGYARVVGWLLNIVEPHVAVSGNNVIGRFSMSIIKSCDAMEANILFCAAALALPAPAARKAVAVPLGILALVTANVVRLCCLYYVGVYYPGSFEFLHIEVWPLLMILFALLDFVVCARFMQGERLLGWEKKEMSHASA